MGSSTLDENLSFDFDPVQIDLLDLQGLNTSTLVNGATVPAGVYQELRLKINADEDAELEPFIELTDGSKHELIIPSGEQSGLKIKKDLVIPVGGEGNYTIDFDVRRSMSV